MNDPQAIKLLVKACWSSAGWKSKLDLTSENLTRDIALDNLLAI